MRPSRGAHRAVAQQAHDCADAGLRHDKPVDYDRYTGYMDARVLIEGLRAAGPSVTRASLVAAMQGLGKLDLGGYVYQFSAQNHHGSNFVDIAVVGSGGVYR